MRSLVVTGPGTVEVQNVPRPSVGDDDILVRIRACGLCGSDGFYIARGGIPPREGATPLGHEAAGEVVEVGTRVTGIAVGAHVVVNPMAAPSGIIGNGGATGALSDYLLIEQAELGVSVALVPEHVPFAVAALNEPMAVARHAVNRVDPRPGDRVVIFGAGPIGLGAAISFRLRGAESVVVVDLIPERLETALQVGADAVIDSRTEDIVARLAELHGNAARRPGEVRPGTDIYLDAAGAPVVIQTILSAVKRGAKVGIVAVHKKPVEVDFGAILNNEVSIITASGYPTEIFEVTDDIAENWERYALLVSDEIPFDEIDRAIELATTPGAADKVVVTFD
ncbi:zinc-dependent alcohol dehydrogenase [Agromyces atrinae]|uniref:2-desacetyl-2-hydroxyethyl bacteriochlorophyllide A dehydrogenase n=1 Tax=Agromyces atrinae TaxID=592376 RepID=A0A4Q2M488_9MICO|nr:zinc-binding dehydrogenase [Agromyces atrinae]NYD68667.1 2-desacetyl-2-hydroxyethyl bacteriochlorophyllide A dehydrogenase [Agromyces atrinae]RXZ86037.1 theronine dehydrogenase [Agromyces atrinae]